MSSYILFSQTSTAFGDRAQWGDGGGAPSAQGTAAPGNTGGLSSFNADTLGPLGPGAKLFDISGGGDGGLGAFGTGTGVGNRLFAGDSKTTLTTNHVTSTTIELAQSGANWNGIKNLEIKLDSDSLVKNVDLKNFVDSRIQIGDDVCAPLLSNANNPHYTVDILNVKRGEVDASLASAALDLNITVFSNGFGTGHFQNSFDNKGSVYGDTVTVGSGTVTNSQFGNFKGKAGYDGDGSYDGTGTFVFMNFGGGKDHYDSTNTAGDNLSGGKQFVAIDKIWGGSDDDVVNSGGGNDILFGDGGSGANLYADPAQATVEVDDSFIVGRLNGGVGNPPGFSTGGDNLGPSFDAGEYVILATGGDLIQLRTGSPPIAGGLGIHNAGDSALGDSEVDPRGTLEAITFDFKTGAHELQIDLTAFWDNEGPGGTSAEVAFYEVTLSDGSTISGSVVANNHVFPAALTLSIGEGDTGGLLIDKITLTPSGADGGFSDFYVTALRACTVVPGEDGNDVLNAGAGSDFVQGDGDTGAAHLCGAAGLDAVVNGGFEDLTGGALVQDHVTALSHFQTYTSIPGWTAVGAVPVPLIEIQIGATGGLLPHGGDNKLELDLHPDDGHAGTNATVQQSIDACEGVEYTLNFFFSSRPNDGGAGSSAFEVLWNGAVVFSFDDDPESVGFQSSGDISVTGGAGLDTLTFNALGRENTLGAYIDDVSLVQKTDFIDIAASGGDQLFLGLADNAKDTVNYTATDDGFDVVRQFQKAGDAANSDVVTFHLNGNTAHVTEVATAEGLSTFISTLEDPTHGVLVVGKTGLVVGTDIIFS